MHWYIFSSQKLHLTKITLDLMTNTKDYFLPLISISMLNLSISMLNLSISMLNFNFDVKFRSNKSPLQRLMTNSSKKVRSPFPGRRPLTFYYFVSELKSNWNWISNFSNKFVIFFFWIEKKIKVQVLLLRRTLPRK